MNEMWREIDDKDFRHKGISHWVYEDQDILIVGVELVPGQDAEMILERKEIVMPEYVYWKHIGPYNKLSEVHDNIYREMQERSLEACAPSVEVYGHWTQDEDKLETEVLVCIKSG